MTFCDRYNKKLCQIKVTINQSIVRSFIKKRIDTDITTSRLVLDLQSTMTHIQQIIKPTNMASTDHELQSSVDDFHLSSFIDRLDVMKRQEQSSIYHISDCLSAQSTRKASLSSSANTNADIWCSGAMLWSTSSISTERLCSPLCNS